MMYISDPEVVRDFMTSKNKCIDKDGMLNYIFREYAQDALIFSFTDEVWERKRKGCTHAFYKDRLNMMVDSFHEAILTSFNEWMSEMETNPDKMATIDLSEAFEIMFSRNIVKAFYGEDISEVLIE